MDDLKKTIIDIAKNQIEGMRLSDKCRFCKEYGEKIEPYLCEYCKQEIFNWLNEKDWVVVPSNKKAHIL